MSARMARASPTIDSNVMTSPLVHTLSHARVYQIATANRARVSATNRTSHMVFSTQIDRTDRSDPLELHQNCDQSTVLGLTEVGRETVDDRALRPLIAALRRDTARTRPVRHVRGTMVQLITERDALRGHVVECGRCVPTAERIARIRREIGRARRRGRTVDRRYENEIATRIVDRSPAQRQGVLVLMEPETVV